MAKGMTKAQAKKAAKKQKKTDAYQRYLALIRKGGRSALQKAMTQYDWMKAGPRTKKIAMQKARSN